MAPFGATIQGPEGPGTPKMLRILSAPHSFFKIMALRAMVRPRIARFAGNPWPDYALRAFRGATFGPSSASHSRALTRPALARKTKTSSAPAAPHFYFVFAAEGRPGRALTRGRRPRFKALAAF